MTSLMAILPNSTARSFEAGNAESHSLVSNACITSKISDETSRNEVENLLEINNVRVGWHSFVHIVPTE